jgi:serine/threonine protein kinase
MSSPILEPGFRLGKYEVLAHIATGGMGAVYKAVDLELRRHVALKVLSTQMASRPNVLERFRREARHSARLSHKNIVTIFENGQVGDLNFLAMEFVEGVDLGQYIERKGRLGGEETRRILMQAARALEHAFEQGVIHRDIKPSNFLLSVEGRKLRVKLTDLGLALVEADDDFKVTRDGSTVGTVDYMAPEQARDSRAADVRSDIYSLGCTAYHMLAGAPPFAEGGLGERVYKHMETPPPDVRQFNPRVSFGLWAILEHMLAKKPEDRYQTPTELLADLKRTPGEESDEGESAEMEEPARPMPRAPSRGEQMPSSADDIRISVTPPSERKTEVAPSPTTPPPADRKPTPATPPPSDDAAPKASVEQARAAADQFERARQVLAEGRGDDYARQLLLSCLKLDPGNTLYRKTLRKMNQKGGGGLLGRWMGSLNAMAIKARLRSAKAAGDHRKVLEQGEEVVARQPADVGSHLDMAEAAEALGLSGLSLWLLEQGRELAPGSVELMKALALRYEGIKEWKRAIALWELVRKAVPDDFEVQRKIDALSVKDHIAKSNYRR